MLTNGPGAGLPWSVSAAALPGCLCRSRPTSVPTFATFSKSIFAAGIKLPRVPLSSEPFRPTHVEVNSTRPRAWWALALLAFINLLNYLDRNVIFALFEPIKRDLVLTDAQLGWLGSAYILVFSVASLPFGVLSDLKSRKTVIAGGVALWSAFTSLGGLVRSYTQLFLCRAAVGIGEAAYGPASNSLVADFFPGRNRAIAMGILAAGVPIGGVLGLLVGGTLEQLYDWRVALMAVGLPGFLCAVLVTRLQDPVREEAPLTIRHLMREMEIELRSLIHQFLPVIVLGGLGALVAWLLSNYYGADSVADVAVLSGAGALGLILTIARWVRLVRNDRRNETPFTPQLENAFGEVRKAGRTVLRTPALIYIFLAGALTSFGMNGLVGWGPTFMSREFSLSAGDAATVLASWGLPAGTLGVLFGGWLADYLRRWTEHGRVISIAAGFLIGGPIAIWVLTQRDLSLFTPGFALAFFFLSWYNGPMFAVIFDIVPARIGATVSGAYLLFIHIAGDAIAMPLIGVLSDHFGIDRAIYLLPLVAIAGGVTVLGARRTRSG